MILSRKRRASSDSCEERWVCVGRHRDASAEAAEASGTRRGAGSGTSFPEKLAAGFLGGLAAQDVDTTRAYGSQLIVLVWNHELRQREASGGRRVGLWKLPHPSVSR